jgi:hypothetical protein
MSCTTSFKQLLQLNAQLQKLQPMDCQESASLTHCHQRQAIGWSSQSSRGGTTDDLEQRAACELSCQLSGGGTTAARQTALAAAVIKCFR